MRKKVASRRMRGIPTHKPNTFLSAKIKKDINPPAIRTFTGAELPAESGDAYLRKKINQFSNIPISPFDIMMLLGYLRPAYQMKRVIDRSDFEEAMRRLRRQQVITKAPVLVQDQLQAIQDFLAGAPDKKKKELLNEIFNKNKVPADIQKDYPDVELDQIKQVVRPELLEPLLKEDKQSYIPATDEEAPELPPPMFELEEEATLPPPREKLMYDDLKDMTLKDLKQTGRAFAVPSLNKYGAKKQSPFSKEDLIYSILNNQEPNTEPYIPELDEPFSEQRKKELRGEGISDVLGNVIDKLMPRALKEKMFSTFIEKPISNLFTHPRNRRR